MMKRATGALAFLTLFGLAVAGHAGAQPADGSTGWTFDLTPMFWGAGLDAEIKSGDQPEKHIEVSFSDVMEALHFGALGTFEGRRGRFGFLFDGMYVDLEKTAYSPQVMGDVDVGIEQGSFSLAGTAQVLEGKIAVDAIGGGRYNSMTTDLEVTSGSATGLQSSDSDGWGDGFVGARVLYPPAQSWMLLGYADVGAGGSKLTWQARAAVSWRFYSILSAELGYRHFYFHREDGGESMKMAKSGFYVGLGIRF